MPIYLLSILVLGYGSAASSWIYLANWILLLVLSVGFVFYFPRLVGFVLTHLLRLWVWRKHKVRISIGSFRVSPLGGRIAARNVVIITQDNTISIIRMHLTWRYWLVRLPRLPAYLFAQEDSPDESSGMSPEQNKRLSTSLQLYVDGLEVFVYNRTQAYTNIVEALARTDAKDEFSSLSSATLADTEAHLSLDFWLSVLPVQMQIKKGAVILGNATTPSIMCASFHSATALLDVCQPPCPQDLFRTSVDVTMEKFQVVLKPNVTYDPTRYSLAEPQAPVTKAERKHRVRRFLARLIPHRSHKKDTNSFEWHGLRRYVDAIEDERVVEITDIEEYAKYSMILDSALTRVVYFFDTPGLHGDGPKEPPPQFGVDVYLSLATIHYGSWADRQRGPIQTMLFPSLSRDSEATVVCEDPGRPRTYAGFRLQVFVQDELVFRLPTREFSKDKSDLAAQGPKRQKITRPFGWLEFKLALESKISSFTSYIASEKGWPNTLSIFMSKPEVRSSVNHDVLFMADEHTLDCDIGFPLQWNGKCVWTFNNKTKNGLFFFLREHAFLINDVVSDFASGEPAPYEYFRPFEYRLNWSVEDYKLYFNVNDHNIINDPLDFDTNKYLRFSGSLLNISFIIPMLGQFSKSSKIDFKINTTSLELDLEVPSWHTVSAFMHGRKKMGSTEAFEISGYYNYYNSIEVHQNNFAVINAIGDNVTLVFFGYLIRYLFTFRENYFGDFKHFKTFEEYSSTLHHGNNPDRSDDDSSADTEFETTPDYWKMLKTENDLNVLFTFLVRGGLIILPCNIYDHQRHIGLEFSSLDVDIHLTNYYMDLQADFSTAQGFGCKSEESQKVDIWNTAVYRESVLKQKPDITIDGFSVHTHRMFGLAPETLTYHCKWDFSSGAIKIDSDPLFLVGLKSVFQNFVFGYKDLENTLIYTTPTVYDLANYSFRCPEVSLKIFTGIENTYLHVSLIDILVGFNDIANYRYSDKIVLSLPEIEVKVVNEDDETMHQAYLKTSLTFTNFCQKAKMLEHRIFQQRYVRRSDAPTHRVPFLLFEENRDDIYVDAYGCLFPTISLPTASSPLTREWAHLQSDGYSASEAASDTDSSAILEALDYLNPTVNYYEDDFVPQTPIRPGYKTDALIFELGAVNAFFTPEGAQSMTSFASKLQFLDLDTLIDMIQIEAINHLKKLIIPLSTIDNIRFVCPSIDLKIAEKPILDITSVLCSSPSVPAVTISVIEPSIAFSSVATKTRRNIDLVEEKSSSLAFHVQEVYLSVHDPNYFTSVFSIHINDFEGWSATDQPSGAISHYGIGEVLCAMETVQAQWTVSFVTSLTSAFKDCLREFAKVKETSVVWRRELIHALTTCARDKNMQHDPAVITKPATILRSCDDHVRFYDSWKLVTKLRSILSELPTYEEEKLRFMNREWKCVPDALKEVMEYFGNWRSWEGSIAQRTNYFRHIFGEELKSEKKSLLFLKLTLGGFNINQSGTTVDYLALHGVRVVLNSDNLGSDVFWDDINGVEYKEENSFLVNVDACDGLFSSLTFDTVSNVIKSLNCEQSTNACQTKETIPEEMVPWIHLLVNFKLFHIRIDLPATFIELYSYDNISNYESYAHAGFNMSNQFREFTVSFGKEEQDYINISLEQLRVTLIESKDSGACKAVNGSLKHFEFKFSDQDGKLDSTISSFFQEDMPKIKNLIPEKQDEGPNSDKNLTKRSTQNNFIVNFLVEKVDWYLDFLGPLRFHYALARGKYSLSHLQGALAFDYFHKSTSCDAVLLEMTILHTEQTNMRLKSTAKQLDSLWMIKSSIDLGYLKVTIPLIIPVTDKVLKQLPAIFERAKMLQSSVPQFDSGIKQEKKVTGKSRNKFDFALDINVSQKYCGLSILKEHCRYTIEYEGLRSKISNLLDADDQGCYIVPFWGDFSLRETRMIVLDALFPVGLSTLLDVNLSFKILNDVQSTTERSSRSLQIESQHFRVCLSPPVVFKISELIDGLSRVIKMHEGLLSKIRPRRDEKEGSKEAVILSSKTRKMHFSSVHVLSYNFCIGWLFGTPHKDYPGFILGTERFFAVLKADLGKLSLMEGYLSVANGTTASSFYSTLSEFNNLNRAFMPKMQLNYIVTDSESLWFSLKGDILDVRFMSNSIIVIERAIESVATVQKYYDDRSRTQRRRRELMTELKAENKKKENSRCSRAFKKIQVTSKFAGAKVFVYRLQEEDDVTGSPPSLSLHSPAVLIAVFYKYTKKLKRSHTVKIEILMSQSDNTLYSSCVPILMDVIDASKLMFRTSKPNSDTENPKVSNDQNSTEPTGGGLNESIAKMLNDINFQFGFIVEKQRFSLSCEPTAKVAAVVVFDGASIVACTGIETVSSIYVIAQVDPIAASLQHIYSDERSGFVEINNIMFSNVIKLHPSIEIVSSTSITDIDGYIKMKQYQDLDLFKDIWYPKKYHTRTPSVTNEVDLAGAKSTYTKFKEVSSTYAIPFWLTMLISNFSLEVDFGAALGTVTLDVDRAWAISRKSSDWLYELKLGLQTLEVGSQGRLGGYVKVERLFVTSSVEWKLKKIPLLEIPLVHLAGGVESLQLKAAFDNHHFAFFSLEGFRLDAFNRKNGINISKDHLFVLIKYDSADVMLTSLAASEFYDIYNTVSRMMEENKTSYTEILKDSNKDHLMENESRNRILEVVKKLETKIEVSTGFTRFQVYPQSFDDTRTLVIDVDKSKASFLQNEYISGVANEIEIRLSNVNASLATTLGIASESIPQFKVQEFIENARKASGGNILAFPKFMISMRTYQKYNSNIVEYLFQSSFGGTVDIRWNLGSVNLVREMYAVHKKALLSRTDYTHERAGSLQEETSIVKKLPEQPNELPSKEDLRKDIEKSFERVSKDSKYVYVPLAPPIIETPRLKELGNATPPLEWFGLHRNKFPDATHEYAIVSMQKLIQQIEEQYSKALSTT